MKTYTVYKLTNTINGKVYIGLYWAKRNNKWFTLEVQRIGGI